MASEEAIEVVSEVETEKVDSEVEVIEKVDSEDPEKVEEEVDSEEVADQTVMPQKRNRREEEATKRGCLIATKSSSLGSELSVVRNQHYGASYLGLRV